MLAFSRSTLLRSAAVLLVAIAALAAYTVAGNNALAASPGVGHAVASGHDRSEQGHTAHLSARQLAFHDGMRKLWEDHITWTRLFIVSFVAGLPDTDSTAQRLLQNQTDLGDAIKPFYGDAAGRQLTALLRDHILIAADLLKAAKAGNSAAVADARKPSSVTPICKVARKRLESSARLNSTCAVLLPSSINCFRRSFGTLITAISDAEKKALRAIRIARSKSSATTGSMLRNK